MNCITAKRKPLPRYLNNFHSDLACVIINRASSLFCLCGYPLLCSDYYFLDSITIYLSSENLS